MRGRKLRWLLAIALTLLAVVYQRMTGPSHPLRGSAQVDGVAVDYRLPRSHGGEGGQVVGVTGPTQGVLEFRRYPTDEPWQQLPMAVDDEGTLSATLPHQGPAGKLEYTMLLGASGQRVPADRTVVIRYRGGVPAGVLVPHILAMFIAMLFANLAGFEALAGGPRLRRDVTVTMVLLTLGGLILGPLVQLYAFGELWTGVPFGWDLTDNKTLVAAIFWFAALVQLWRVRPSGRALAIVAALVTLGVYSIPHSAMGSELDPQTGEIKTG